MTSFGDRMTALRFTVTVLAVLKASYGKQKEFHNGKTVISNTTDLHKINATSMLGNSSISEKTASEDPTIDKTVMLERQIRDLEKNYSKLITFSQTVISQLKQRITKLQLGMIAANDEVLNASRLLNKEEKQHLSTKEELKLYKIKLKRAEKLLDLVRIRCEIDDAEKYFPLLLANRTGNREQDWERVLKRAKKDPKLGNLGSLGLDQILTEIERRHLSVHEFSQKLSELYTRLTNSIDNLTHRLSFFEPPNIKDFGKELFLVADIIRRRRHEKGLLK